MEKKLLFYFGLLVISACYSQKDQSEDLLIGDWKLVNPEYSQYEALNVSLSGVRFYSDSLEFFADYMSNPMFNYRKYSISTDSITIEFESGSNTFAVRHSRDTLHITNSSYTYKYVKLHTKISNEANRIEFKSRNPGWEVRHFFDLTIYQNGTFLYNSKTEDRVLEGRLKENYIAFIFDKLHTVELPIQADSNEVIPAGDHVFTMEIFDYETRLDSVTYSRKLEGAYTKWLASILQSAPLWIDEAVVVADN